MSLVCHECKQNIEFGEPLRAVTHPDSQTYSAVCISCIKRMPAKFLLPVGTPNARLLLYRATSDENFTGAYTWSNFKLMDVLYAIADQAVRYYLPETAETYEIHG